MRSVEREGRRRRRGVRSVGIVVTTVLVNVFVKVVRPPGLIVCVKEMPDMVPNMFANDPASMQVNAT